MHETRCAGTTANGFLLENELGTFYYLKILTQYFISGTFSLRSILSIIFYKILKFHNLSDNDRICLLKKRPAKILITANKPKENETVIKG